MANEAVALIPAGGRGQRMGAPIPKQFLELGGVPILVHSLRVLQHSSRITDVIVAVPESERNFCLAEIVERYQFTKVKAVISGGPQRQDSVRLALQAAGTNHQLVLVHDAVRPFLTSNMVVDVLDRAAERGAALIALPMRDTVKRVGPDFQVKETVDRKGLWLAQTPQAFRAPLLHQAHEKAKQEGVQVTDDAQLMEYFGHPVSVVEGSGENIKITRPEDLVIGEAILSNRVGQVS